MHLWQSVTVRTLAVVLGGLTALFAAAAAVSLHYLEQSFDRLERAEAMHALTSAELLVAQQCKSVGDSTRDYAQWNDAADYLAGEAPDFESVNFTINSINNLDVDAIVVLRKDASVSFQGVRPGAFSPGAASRVDGLADLPAEVLAEWRSLAALVALCAPADATSGLTATGGRAAIVGASPVLMADGSGPCRGVLVMVRVLGPDRLAALSSLARTAIRVDLPPAGALAASGADELDLCSDGWRGTRTVAGLLGRPGAALTVSGAPMFRDQRRETAWVLVVNFALVALACSLLTGLALKRGVLGRLADFSRRAVSMRADRAAAMRMPVRGADELDRLAVAINDLLDELQQVQDRLSFDALHDSLTGLANRALLMERLAFAQAHATRDPSRRFAVILMDLDSFKTVNDLYGHQAGDELLQVVTMRLHTVVREIDTVARLGGDEFVLVLSEASSVAECEVVCRRLLEVVAEPVERAGLTLQVTASIGLVHSERQPALARPGDLLRDADIAMYRAKDGGRNRYAVFDAAMRDHLSERHGLEQELRAAVRSGSLAVHYQPIVAARTGTVESVEALLRWPHPERGLLTPVTFVPMAEELGLIADLDAWVLPEALTAVARLRRLAPQLAVSVNLSVARLLQPDLPAAVERALRAAGVPGTALRLELTETGFTRHEGALADAMAELLALGVQIHLDDFGTGYSSLKRLHALPFHVMKLDRFFVAKLALGYSSVVSGIVGVAHALGKEVVAEGVETAAEYRELAGLTCEYFQGYYFARPMPEEQLAQLLREGRHWHVDDAQEAAG